MKHHACQVPAPGQSLKQPDRWECPECEWVWRLNPFVHQWFRDTATGWLTP